MRNRIMVMGLGWLLAAGLAGAAPTEPAAKACCPPGQQDCQVGVDAHICWPEARHCPEAGASRDFPKCGPRQKWCQVGIDDYICWPFSKPCPVPTAKDRIKCDAGWKECRVTEVDSICVPDGDDCPESEARKH